MYLIYIHSTNQTKNKLEAEFLEFLQMLERHAVQSGKLNAFKQKVNYKYEELKGKHPRCTPVKKMWMQHGKDWVLHCDYTNFTLLKMKENGRK